MMTLMHIEDLSVGDSFDLGEVTVSKDEIITFAERYDPQPFHVDPEAATDSMFDQLVASGWHTVALVNRQFILEHQLDSANLGGRGADDLQWHVPVRPGDRLSIEGKIVDLRPSGSRDDRGYVEYAIEAENADEETVLTMTVHTIIARRGN